MPPGVGTDEVDYGYGDASRGRARSSKGDESSVSSNRDRSLSQSRGRAHSSKGDDSSVHSRDRSRSQSRGRSVARRMSMKTFVMDPLAMSQGNNQSLSNFFNSSDSSLISSRGGATDVGSSGNLCLEIENDLSDAEDEAMMLPDSTQIETNDSHDRQKNHPHRGLKENGSGRTRSENKTRNHHKSSRSRHIESSDTKASERSHKDRHHHHQNHCKSPQKSRSRVQSSGDSDREKSSLSHKHHKHAVSGSNKKDGEERQRGVKKSTSSEGAKSEKHHETKTSSKLRAPSQSPKTKKKAVRHKFNDSCSGKEQKESDKDHRDSDSSSSSDSDDADSSSSDSSEDDKHGEGGTVSSVMQFDPSAAGGTVKVGQKEGKDGISEFSDPVGEAQRLQGHKKKPVFSFLDSECSSDEKEDKESNKTKKGGVVRGNSGKKQSISTKHSSREKPSTTTSASRKKTERTSSKKEKHAEKEHEKQPEKKFDETILSMSGFNSTTCHFCHKDVGPMIMQCMSCKETYFCQKCMRKGLVSPHQQECAQRKVDEREQRATEARQRVAKARSMPDLLEPGTPGTASEITKRRKPKKCFSAIETPTCTRDSESLFDKQPLLAKKSDAYDDEENGAKDSPSTSPRKKLGIGKFFGGLGKSKKKKNDDNDNSNIEGMGDDDDDGSVTGSSRRGGIFHRPSFRNHHTLMDDDSTGSM